MFSDGSTLYLEFAALGRRHTGGTILNKVTICPLFNTGVVYISMYFVV